MSIILGFYRREWCQTERKSIGKKDFLVLTPESTLECLPLNCLPSVIFEKCVHIMQVDTIYYYNSQIRKEITGSNVEVTNAFKVNFEDSNQQEEEIEEDDERRMIAEDFEMNESVSENYDSDTDCSDMESSEIE